MEYKQLVSTKRRLTIIFSLLVFFVAFLLQVSFFSMKYIKTTKIEKEALLRMSYNIRSKKLPPEKISLLFPTQKKFRFPGKNGHINERKTGNDQKYSKDILSYIVIDDDDNIVQQKMNYNIDFETVEKNLLEAQQKIVIDSDSIFYCFLYNGDHRILLFKKVHYSFSDYIEDILYFSMVILCFSVLFYCIGYQFVSRNLKPLEENLKDMHDFIHNAGHELKTPLAVISSNLQLMKQVSKYDAHSVLEGIQEVEKLNHLIESLLELSDITSHHECTYLYLDRELADIVKDFSSDAEKKQIKIDFHSQKNVKLFINKQYFYILCSNILGNAIKYTSNGGNISVTLSEKYITISDTGIGISKSVQKKIFDRFYQTDQSRGGSGFGIGLSLVKKIADMYKFRIGLESDLGKGSKFTIYFG